MRWIFLLSILLCSSAQASVFRGAPGHTIKYGGFYAYRKITICINPDTQNIISQDDQLLASDPNNSTKTCAPYSAVDRSCVGQYCQKSPYCSGNWVGTGQVLMSGMAYDQIGRYADIDWTQIQGPDPIPSHWTNAHDHHRCDVIISLGDMMDIPDAVVATDPNYADLADGPGVYPHMQQQYDSTLRYWKIIKESGIPFLILQGNHDPRKLVQKLATDLSYSSLSFYYGTSPGGWSYAIKFPTNTGKPFCVIGSPFTPFVAIDASTQTEINWIRDTVGCGGGYPTVFVNHASASSDTGDIYEITNFFYQFTDCPSSLFRSAVNAPFLNLGGHYTPLVPKSRKIFVAAGSPAPGTTASICRPGVGDGFVTTFDYVSMFVDFQEMDRHGSTIPFNIPYGGTASDSAGIYTTVITIDPRYSTFEAHEWSAYWNTISDPPADPGGTSPNLVTPFSHSFNFDARFP